MSSILSIKGIVIINSKRIPVPKKALTIMELGTFHGITVPRFCYHERLSIAGNCRMCLVAMYKSFKPIIACATPVTEHLEIYTNTALVENSKEYV